MDSRQTDRQTYRETDRQQTDRQTDRHTERQTDSRQTDRHTERQTDRGTDRQTQRQTDRQRDGRTSVRRVQFAHPAGQQTDIDSHVLLTATAIKHNTINNDLSSTDASYSGTAADSS